MRMKEKASPSAAHLLFPYIHSHHLLNSFISSQMQGKRRRECLRTMTQYVPSIRICRLHYYCRNPLDLAKFITIDCSCLLNSSTSSAHSLRLVFTPNEPKERGSQASRRVGGTECNVYRAICVTLQYWRVDHTTENATIWRGFQQIGVQLFLFTESLTTGAEVFEALEWWWVRVTRTWILIIPSLMVLQLKN